MAAFAAVTGRLFHLQVVESPRFARIGEAQRAREILFPARRGVIFDRHGDPLAISIDLHTVWADPTLVEDPVGQARALARALGRDRAEVSSRLAGSSPGDQFEYIARQVKPRLAERVRALDQPGVFLTPEPRRFYPDGRLGAHVLGYVNVDGDGAAGVEAQYDPLLSGRAGRMVLERDPDGRPLPQAEFLYRRPRPGRSLLLTLDRKLQYRTQQHLEAAVDSYGAAAGTAIVLAPGTGEVLALANSPAFNPNRPGDDFDSQRNRALTDMYEPGSAFKIVTAAAALEEGIVDPETTFVVPDSRVVADKVFNDSHAHPTEKMTVAEIIEQSSNVGTIDMGLKLGASKLYRYMRRFGFGDRTGTGFPGESPGRIPHPREWSGTTIATVPIGQGIAVTALQMAAAYGAVANDGRWVEPKLVHAVMDTEGELRRTAPPESRRVVAAATARDLTRMLTGVVRRGTGVNAHIAGYAVAGKTGTAQKPEGGAYGGSYIASFAGFAPASRPEVVVVVVLDEPTPIWGGSTAAPAFKEIASDALARLGVAPVGNARKAAQGADDPAPSEPPALD